MAKSSETGTKILYKVVSENVLKIIIAFLCAFKSNHAHYKTFK